MDSVLSLLNRVSDALLQLDPDTLERLAGLEGRVVCMSIDPPGLDLFVVVTGRGLEFSRERAGPVDVTLKGHAADFLHLAVSRGRGNLNSSRGIVIEGDAEIGQSFQRILGQADLDWEELLARFAGDTAARKIGVVFRDLGDWAEQSARLSRENVRDYLTEERKMLVGEVMMERFQAEVDRLRADVDRLQLRIDRLDRMPHEPAGKESP